MRQDLRKLFKEEAKDNKPTMKDGHEARFLEKLDKALPPEKKPSYAFLKIAAAIVVFLGLGALGYHYVNSSDSGQLPQTIVHVSEEKATGISLGDLSPELEKVENYYVTNINLELSKLEVSSDNKVLVGSYMERLADLNTEYERLNTELNAIGPNDQTITALINNLQLRLQLFYKLKEKLNELKSSKNEQEII